EATGPIPAMEFPEAPEEGTPFPRREGGRGVRSEPTTTETDGAAVLDPGALERLRSMLSKAPPGALANLIDTFLAAAPKLLATMAQAIEARQLDELRRAAHSLKSNAASFGATELAEGCRELEELAKAMTFEGAAEQHARLVAELPAVEKALAAVRGG